MEYKTCDYCCYDIVYEGGIYHGEIMEHECITEGDDTPS